MNIKCCSLDSTVKVFNMISWLIWILENVCALLVCWQKCSWEEKESILVWAFLQSFLLPQQKVLICLQQLINKQFSDLKFFVIFVAQSLILVLRYLIKGAKTSQMLFIYSYHFWKRPFRKVMTCMSTVVTSFNSGYYLTVILRVKCFWCL